MKEEVIVRCEGVRIEYELTILMKGKVIKKGKVSGNEIQPRSPN